jgi:hypothetical protein
MRAFDRLARNEAAFDILKWQRDVVDHHRLPAPISGLPDIGI